MSSFDDCPSPGLIWPPPFRQPGYKTNVWCEEVSNWVSYSYYTCASYESPKQWNKPIISQIEHEQLVPRVGKCVAKDTRLTFNSDYVSEMPCSPLLFSLNIPLCEKISAAQSWQSRLHWVQKPGISARQAKQEWQTHLGESRSLARLKLTTLTPWRFPWRFESRFHDAWNCDGH